MKYLIVSDNHGDRNILVEIVNRYVDRVDHMFHCGDSELKAMMSYGNISRSLLEIVIMILDIKRNKLFQSVMMLFT